MATGNAPKMKNPFPISQEVCRQVMCCRSPSRNTPGEAGGNRCPPQPGRLFAARSWIFPAEMVNLSYSLRMRHVSLGDPVGKRVPSTCASRYTVPETVRVWLPTAGSSNLAKTGSAAGKNAGYPTETGRIMLLEGEFDCIVHRGGRVPRFPARTYIFPSWLLCSLRCILSASIPYLFAQGFWDRIT